MNSKLAPVLMVLPIFALYLVFVFYPIAHAVVSSFFSWNGIPTSPQVFVGLRNYATIIDDPRYLRAFANSGRFIAGSLLVLLPLSFVLALITTSGIRGARVMKAAYFLPVVLSLTAISLMWRFILFPNGGPLNTFLERVQLHHMAHNWLGDVRFSIWAVIFVNMWTYAGFNMLIFAAGLVAIPTEVWDSVEIDGARGATRFWHITLPLMRESFRAFIILAVSGSLKVFDIVFVMTGGGPNGSSDTPATLLFFQAFQFNRFGLGNAIGTCILVFGLLLTLVVNGVAKKLED